MKQNIFQQFFRSHQPLWEFLRYALLAFGTKLINVGVEALVRFCFEPTKYGGLWQLLWGRTDLIYVSVVATVIGFMTASLAEYFLSLRFVFSKNGKGETLSGFLFFMVLSVGGLGISVLCKYVGETVWKFPWLAVNLVGGFIVLAYNYIAKKRLLFYRRQEKDE